MNYNPLIKYRNTSFVSPENNLVVYEYDAKESIISFEVDDEIVDVYFSGTFQLSEYGNFTVNGWEFEHDLLLDCSVEWFLESNKQFILEHIIQGEYYV